MAASTLAGAVLCFRIPIQEARKPGSSRSHSLALSGPHGQPGPLPLLQGCRSARPAPFPYGPAHRGVHRGHRAQSHRDLRARAVLRSFRTGRTGASPCGAARRSGRAAGMRAEPRPRRRRRKDRIPLRRCLLAFADLKIAVTGATGRAGQAVRTILARKRPTACGPKTSSCSEHSGDEAIISSTRDEATLIGALDPESIADRDLVFLCGTAAEARLPAVARASAARSSWTCRAPPPRGGNPRREPSVEGAALFGKAATVAAPARFELRAVDPARPARAAAAGRREHGRRRASAGRRFRRSAGSRSSTGRRSLLLNFGEVPRSRHTAGQIAFSLVPQTLLDEGDGGEAGPGCAGVGAGDTQGSSDGPPREPRCAC